MVAGNIKIAQVVCVLPPYGGGLGTVAHEYAEHLFDLGYDSTAITIENTELDLKNNKKYSVVTEKPLWQIGLGAIMPKLTNDLKDFGIVTLHWPFFGATLPTIKSKLRNRQQKLFIYYHQDLILPGWKNIFYKYYLKFFWPILFHYADKVLVSSYDYLENSLIKKYYTKKPNKFVELPFGVTKKFQPGEKDSALLRNHHLTPQDKIVGFVGGLDDAHYFKGVNYLIEALTQVPEQHIKALIVGRGNLLPQYEQLAKERGIQDRVIFTGYVNEGELPKYYNLFDTLVLPSVSKNEAFGLVLLEAQACAKPVIASDLPGVRTVLADRQSGLLVPSADTTALARAIRKIILDEDTYEEMSEAARARTQKFYDWDQIIQKLITTYNI